MLDLLVAKCRAAASAFLRERGPTAPRVSYSPRTSRGDLDDAPRMAGSGREQERPVSAPASVTICVSELEPGVGGHHRRSPGADGSDDLLGIDPLGVDRGGARVDVTELALE